MAVNRSNTVDINRFRDNIRLYKYCPWSLFSTDLATLTNVIYFSLYLLRGQGQNSSMYDH